MHARRVGPYRIERDLGRGAQGAVLQAVDTRTNQRVALKVLASPTERVRRRFLREGRALASLRHPNIVAVREVLDGVAPVLVVDFVQGESLQARLDRQGPLPVRDAVAIASKLALALDYAHQVGVLHRDVKPENVLLAGAEPVLVDFGLARLTDPAAAHSRVTEDGQLLGTPGYWSPEQAAGVHEPDPRSDVYSLGATLYALLTGEPPFVADTLMDALALVANATPEPPSRRRPGVPAALDAICLRCLAKDPAARYPTARALAHDLEAFLHAPPAPAEATPANGLAAPRPRSRRTRPAATPPPRRGLAVPVTVGFAVAALVLGALALGWAMGSRPGPAAPAPVTEAGAPVPDAPPAPAPAATPRDVAILAVRVVDERGAPASDAVVVALPSRADVLVWRERRTDPDGRVLVHVADAAEPLTVHAWNDRAFGRAGPLEPRRGELTEARVVLDRRVGAGRLRVRVLAGDPPRPYQGVLRYRMGTQRFGMRRCDDAPWVIDDAPAPLAAIGLLADGVSAACLVVPVDPGETIDATVVLTPAVTLRGRLVGQLPRPLEGKAHVGMELGPWGRRTVADAAIGPDGAFEVRGLRPGALHRVAVTLAGYLPIELPDDVPGEDGAAVEVRLPEAEAVVVQVEDDRGAPVEGAEVELDLPGDHEERWWPSALRGRTDRRGRAAWLGAPVVPAVVSVRAPGFRPATVTDAMGAFVRVRLEPVAAWSGVVGSVSDEGGRPLVGVVVRARTAEGQDLPSAVTDEVGQYRITAPVGATVELTFEAPDRARVVRRVRVDEDPSAGRGVHVALVRGVRVKGAVHGALGPRVESVRAAGPRGEEERAAVSSTGAFDLGRLAPGRWVFTAVVRREDGGTGFHHTDVVLEGDVQHVVLSVEHADHPPR